MGRWGRARLARRDSPTFEDVELRSSRRQLEQVNQSVFDSHIDKLIKHVVNIPFHAILVLENVNNSVQRILDTRPYCRRTI